MSVITTHVLDLSRGVPAAGIAVTLERADSAGVFARVASAVTDQEGRVRTFGTAAGDLVLARYRLSFRVDSYFAALGVACFFPEVQLLFNVTDAARAHHVPLLLSPFGYSTYRGS
jgi:5-hydroxyisourate hydrolase